MNSHILVPSVLEIYTFKYQISFLFVELNAILVGGHMIEATQIGQRSKTKSQNLQCRLAHKITCRLCVTNAQCSIMRKKAKGA